MGEFTLWAVHGPHALLVCVIRGVPPRSLRADLSAILERIHFRYGDAIRSYSGDTASVPEVETELAACLQLQARHEKTRSKKAISWPLLVVLLLIAGALGYFAVTGWQQARQVDKLQTALDQTPGLYVAGIERDGRTIVVRGMRDPQAPEVGDVAIAAGVEGLDIAAEMRAYYSLEPALIAERAATRFGTPDGVRYSVEGSKLIVTGPAPLDWQTEVTSAAPGLAGIESVKFRMSPEQRAALERAAALRRLDALIGELSGQTFYFAADTTLTEASAAELPAYVDRLMAAGTDGASLDLKLRVTVTGYADAVGGVEINAVVAEERAEFFASALRERGWTGGIVTRFSPTSVGDAAPVDLEQRRVTVELQRSKSPAPQ